VLGKRVRCGRSVSPSVVTRVAGLIGQSLLVSDQPATDARQFLTDCLGWGVVTELARCGNVTAFPLIPQCNE